MSRWSAHTHRPYLDRWGGIKFAQLSVDWGLPEQHTDGWASGHMTMTVCLLGFGLSVTRWTDPDVYGDGGVA